MFGDREDFEQYEDQYALYAEREGGLPLVVVPTLDGRPVGSGNDLLLAEQAGRVIASLGLDRPAVLPGDDLAGDDLPGPRLPVRLLANPLDDVPPGEPLIAWAARFANQVGATVYLAVGGQFSDHFRDFTASEWRMIEPALSPGSSPMPRYVRDPGTGLLVPGPGTSAQLAEPPAYGEPPAYAGPLPGITVAGDIAGPEVQLPVRVPATMQPPSARSLTEGAGLGWVWLDRARGVAVPADRGVTGGVRMEGEGWRAARPGAGRGYAVHLGTGWIAVARESGERIVVPLSDGWVDDGSGLVHLSSGLALRGADAGAGWAGQGRRDRLRGRPQLNREDLLGWLAVRGVLLAGEVAGLASGPGWQQVSAVDGSGTRWVWNTPGAGAGELPAGLRRGTASGAGNLCLLDSLRQLLGGDTTVQDLRGVLGGILPEGNEARGQLDGGQMVDVWSVLPAFTGAYQVRVQVFQDIPGPGGHPAILPSALQGPVTDRAGNLTRILHLFWRGDHFEPLFAEGPVITVQSQALTGLVGVPNRDAAFLLPFVNTEIRSRQPADEDYQLSLEEFRRILETLPAEVTSTVAGVSVAVAERLFGPAGSSGGVPA
jgi:hypothetical protein